MSEISISVVKEAYGRVAYSHKTQEKAKEINEFYAIIIKWVNVILVGATTLSAALNLFLTPDKVGIATTILACCSLMFIVAQLSFDPDGRARMHKRCADKLWLISEQYINLLSDMSSGNISDEETKKKRDQITFELSKIYDDALPAGGRAYKKARKALKIDKELTFTSKELEQLLPESLRIKKT